MPINYKLNRGVIFHLIAFNRTSYATINCAISNDAHEFATTSRPIVSSLSIAASPNNSYLMSTLADAPGIGSGSQFSSVSLYSQTAAQFLSLLLLSTSEPLPLLDPRPLVPAPTSVLALPRRQLRFSLSLRRRSITAKTNVSLDFTRTLQTGKRNSITRASLAQLLESSIRNLDSLYILSLSLSLTRFSRSLSFTHGELKSAMRTDRLSALE